MLIWDHGVEAEASHPGGRTPRVVDYLVDQSRQTDPDHHADQLIHRLDNPLVLRGGILEGSDLALYGIQASQLLRSLGVSPKCLEQGGKDIVITGMGAYRRHFFILLERWFTCPSLGAGPKAIQARTSVTVIPMMARAPASGSFSSAIV
jgi:hypothetical protein